VTRRRARRPARPLRGRGRLAPEGGVRRLPRAGGRRPEPLADRGRRPSFASGPRGRARCRSAGAFHRRCARMTTEAPQLAGTEDHPHARMVLGSALASGSPSHAYLFHGPPGTGKRTAARALPPALLAEGEDDREAARTRVLHGTHPDLTWVRPTGAHVMRVSDVDGPVVAAAGRTPFGSRRRVFVLERVDTMDDEVANGLLKTLEE